MLKAAKTARDARAIGKRRDGTKFCRRSFKQLKHVVLPGDIGPNSNRVFQGTSHQARRCIITFVCDGNTIARRTGQFCHGGSNAAAAAGDDQNSALMAALINEGQGKLIVLTFLRKERRIF